jgi:hypothetical protein
LAPVDGDHRIHPNAKRRNKQKGGTINRSRVAFESNSAPINSIFFPLPEATKKGEPDTKEKKRKQRRNSHGRSTDFFLVAKNLCIVIVVRIVDSETDAQCARNLSSHSATLSSDSSRAQIEERFSPDVQYFP